MPAFGAKYGLNDKTAADLTSNIVSTLQAGCFFGSLASYWAADRFGRRPSLLVAAAITILGVIIQTASDGHTSALYVGRLVAGFGVGAASMLTPLYVSENAPRAIRGGLTGLYQLFIATGVMLSFWVNYVSYTFQLHRALLHQPSSLCQALMHTYGHFVRLQDQTDQYLGISTQH